MLYPIAIHKDEGTDYGVTVPDLPGCFSAGSSMDEAMAMAREAIECHIEGLLMDGEEVPTPRHVEHHAGNPDHAGATWAVVEVDLSKLSGKAKRVNITIPEVLLKRIDSYAESHGQSRSGFLVNAALSAMRE